jgi:putative lipoic acid-binding regulatory protein
LDDGENDEGDDEGYDSEGCQFEKSTKDKKTGIKFFDYYPVLNELDWTLCAPKFVYRLALKLASDKHKSYLQLFEIASESFFDQLCQYIKEHFDDAKAKKQSGESKSAKFNIKESLFRAMTLEQLDKLNQKLTAMGVNIKEKRVYVAAYFSKQFSDELSLEY